MTAIIPPAFRHHERGDFAGTLINCDDAAEVLAALDAYGKAEVNVLLTELELTPGQQGDPGPAGPNQLTASTATNLTGILTGDGTSVSASAVLPIDLGGTGAITAATARAALEVYSNTDIDTGKLSLANKLLPSSFIPSDYSIDQSSFSKNSLCNASVKVGGGVTLKVDGTPVVLSAADQLALVDGSGSFMLASLFAAAPTTVEIVVDTGATIPNYSSSFWQVGVAMRQPFGNPNFTQPNSLQVLCSSNGTNWGEPVSNEWKSSNLTADTRAGVSMWLSDTGQPKIAGATVTTPRYVKFVLTNFNYNPANGSKQYLWITQLLFRHVLEESTPQYAKKAGDTFLGDMRFNLGLVDKNGSKGTAGQVPQSNGTGITYKDRTLPLRSGSSNPSAGNIPAGESVLWLNTTTNEIRHWTNNGGTLFKSAVYTT